MRAKSFSEIYLGIRQRADIDGQNTAFGGNSASSITDLELQQRIWADTARIWLLIRQNFGANYYFNTYYLSTQSGVYSYPLPYDFLDIIKVGIQQGGTGSNLFWNILPYNVHEQDRMQLLPGFQAPINTGYSTMRYQLQGQTITFQPQTGSLPQYFRLQYTPTAPFLVPTLPTAWAATTSYSQGALVTANITVGSVTTTQTFLALNSGTSGGSAPAWNVPGTTLDGTGATPITWAYKGPNALFATEFDGIAGWEDYIEIAGALYVSIKQESSNVTDLRQSLAEFVEMVEVEAANRQAGDPPTVTGGWGTMEGGAFGGGWGGDWGGGW